MSECSQKDQIAGQELNKIRIGGEDQIYSNSRQKLQFELNFGINDHHDNATDFFEQKKFQHESHDHENMFSYIDDDRRRLSIHSQSDHELEDISGKADMSDRLIKVQISQQSDMGIIENLDKSGLINSLQIDKNNQSQHQNKFQNEQLNFSQLTEIELYRNFLVVGDNNKSIKQQPFKIQQNQFVKSPRQQIKKQVKPISIKQTLISTPIKKQSALNKKVSPQTPISPSLNAGQKRQEKSKIAFIKENVYTFKESPSSIRDWFRSSTPKQSPKQLKSDIILQLQSTKYEAEQKYRKQLQLDMLELKLNQKKHKNNKVFALTDRDKKYQKINKTDFVGSNKSKFGKEVKNDDLKMMLKISLQKKKQNYETLKQWKKRGIQKMEFHQNIVEMIQNQIDKRIKSSLLNFLIYLEFYKQKLKQQQQFIQSPVIHTKYPFQSNTISKSIYMNCSLILNSLAQKNVDNAKKVQNFVLLIRNDLLNNLMERHFNQSQKELLKIRDKISTLKNSLKKYNIEIEEKSKVIVNLFFESVHNVSNKSFNDFYSVQIDYLKCINQQIFMQRKLGQNCLEYYHAAISQQLKHSQILKKSLFIYTKGLKEAYNIDVQDVQLQQLSKGKQKQQIGDYFCLQNMLDEASGKLFKQKLKVQENNTAKQLRQYLKNFEFEAFNPKMLLLKEFHTKYLRINNSKDKSQNQQTCYMVITVDFWIHLSFSYQKSTSNLLKPDVSFRISDKQLQIRQQKQQYIDIVKKQQKRSSMISYFWENKNEKSYRLKFNSKDSKQQFCDYIKKLMF